jgi:hypothetical protein
MSLICFEFTGYCDFTEVSALDFRSQRRLLQSFNYFPVACHAFIMSGVFNCGPPLLQF